VFTQSLHSNGCTRHIVYRCVRSLPSNGCFPGSTVLTLNKYATILFRDTPGRTEENHENLSQDIPWFEPSTSRIQVYNVNPRPSRSVCICARNPRPLIWDASRAVFVFLFLVSEDVDGTQYSFPLGRRSTSGDVYRSICEMFYHHGDRRPILDLVMI
jgi:hypothetical protein